MNRLSIVLFVLVACKEPPPPPPEPVTLAIQVGGMHCDGCAMAITEALEKLDGVRKCDVQFDTKRAEVVLDPARVTPAEIASTIAGLGYHPTMPGEAPPAVKPPVDSVAAPDAPAAADEPANEDKGPLDQSAAEPTAP